MQRFIFTAFLILTGFSSAFGQIELSYSKSLSLQGVTAPRLAGDLVLVGADSKPSVAEVAIITAKSPSKFLRLKARKSLFEVGTLKQISETEWVLSGAGEWIVEASSFDPERGIDEALLRIVIGGQPPKPEPGPGPQPEPKPEPEPNSLPFGTLEGLRVLIVYESSQLNQLTESQRSVLYAKDFREWMTENCAKNATNFPEWRVWDKDTDVTKESKVWQDVMARKRDSVPWLCVSNGKRGYEGPLPASYDAAVDLIKSFAEAK